MKLTKKRQRKWRSSHNEIKHRVFNEHERQPARVVSQLVCSEILVALNEGQNKQEKFIYKQWYPENIVVLWCIDWSAKLVVEEAMEWICVGL